MVAYEDYSSYAAMFLIEYGEENEKLVVEKDRLG